MGDSESKQQAQSTIINQDPSKRFEAQYWDGHHEPPRIQVIPPTAQNSMTEDTLNESFRTHTMTSETKEGPGEGEEIHVASSTEHESTTAEHKNLDSSTNRNTIVMGFFKGLPVIGGVVTQLHSQTSLIHVQSLHCFEAEVWSGEHDEIEHVPSTIGGDDTGPEFLVATSDDIADAIGDLHMASILNCGLINGTPLLGGLISSSPSLSHAGEISHDRVVVESNITRFEAEPWSGEHFEAAVSPGDEPEFLVASSADKEFERLDNLINSGTYKGLPIFSGLVEKSTPAAVKLVEAPVLLPTAKFHAEPWTGEHHDDNIVAVSAPTAETEFLVARSDDVERHDDRLVVNGISNGQVLISALVDRSTTAASPISDVPRLSSIAKFEAEPWSGEHSEPPPHQVESHEVEFLVASSGDAPSLHDGVVVGGVSHGGTIISGLVDTSASPSTSVDMPVLSSVAKFEAEPWSGEHSEPPPHPIESHEVAFLVASSGDAPSSHDGVVVVGVSHGGTIISGLVDTSASPSTSVHVPVLSSVAKFEAEPWSGEHMEADTAHGSMQSEILVASSEETQQPQEGLVIGGICGHKPLIGCLVDGSVGSRSTVPAKPVLSSAIKFEAKPWSGEHAEVPGLPAIEGETRLLVASSGRPEHKPEHLVVGGISAGKCVISGFAETPSTKSSIPVFSPGSATTKFQAEPWSGEHTETLTSDTGATTRVSSHRTVQQTVLSSHTENASHDTQPPHKDQDIEVLMAEMERKTFADKPRMTTNVPSPMSIQSVQSQITGSSVEASRPTVVSYQHHYEKTTSRGHQAISPSTYTMRLPEGLVPVIFGIFKGAPVCAGVTSTSSMHKVQSHDIPLSLGELTDQLQSFASSPGITNIQPNQPFHQQQPTEATAYASHQCFIRKSETSGDTSDPLEQLNRQIADLQSRAAASVPFQAQPSQRSESSFSSVKVESTHGSPPYHHEVIQGHQHMDGAPAVNTQASSNISSFQSASHHSQYSKTSTQSHQSSERTDSQEQLQARLQKQLDEMQRNIPAVQPSEQQVSLTTNQQASAGSSSVASRRTRRIITSTRTTETSNLSQSWSPRHVEIAPNQPLIRLKVNDDMFQGVLDADNHIHLTHI